jgi:hypothetical protein
VPHAGENDCPSETQQAWEELALRLRLQVEFELTKREHAVSKANDDTEGNVLELEQLTSAAWQIFNMQRLSASYDNMVRRDGGGF